MDGHRNICSDGHFENDSVATPIFGNVSDAMFDGIAGSADLDTFSVHKKFAGVGRGDAKEDARQFGAASADESSKSENFARVKFEGNVCDVGRATDEISDGES